MTVAVLSIGSNLGDRRALLQGAADAMRRWLRAASPVFETPPWGPVPQDDYLNAVLLVEDAAADQWEWLRRAHAAEDAAGRTRKVRWGPRSLDVDVVDVLAGGAGSIVQDDPALTLPHPRAAQRAFVLVPWLALDAAAVLAGRPVAELVAALPAAELDGVRRLDELVLR